MKELKEFKGYKVTKDGKVWSDKSERFLKTSNTKDYDKVTLMIDGKRHTCTVHRLIAQTYLPNPLNKKTVNHKNGIKTDNRLSNLEWATKAENTQHAFDNGLINKRIGEQVYGSKLTAKCIETIFYLKSLGWKQYKIAEEMDVSKGRISEILNKKSWRHLHEQK